MITFVIKNGKVVSAKNGVYSEAEIIMTDKALPTEITISKQDVYDTELPGAKLTLTGVGVDKKTANTFTDNMITAGEGAKVVTDSGKELVWVSGTEPTNVSMAACSTKKRND